MSRPGRLVGVCGTGTEVGKTWVSAHVLAALRADGVSVAARKPLQSFDPDDAAPTDAAVLAAATGEDPHDVCPSEGWYPVPMAPPMAAEVLGRRCPALAEVVAGTTFETIFSYHADTVALGTMAARAAVSHLVLTHLIPPPDTAAEADAFAADVRDGGYTGTVTVGQDLTTVTLG